MERTPLILVCDDQPMVHETLGVYLDAEGFRHVSAMNGEEALARFESDRPDLVVLDLMMPGRNGIEVCREIRRKSPVPIIMLTARGEEVDRILGLELGADDYIVKPFSPREVVARIRAVLRRTLESQEGSLPPVLRFDDLVIDLGRYEVAHAGIRLPFTPKEVELLHLLASHPGQVFDREKILGRVWGDLFLGDSRAVDTQIKRIRRKLPQEGVRFGIRTIYGIGYKFEAMGP